jgi:hypothetical protein
VFLFLPFYFLVVLVMAGYLMTEQNQDGFHYLLMGVLLDVGVAD